MPLEHADPSSSAGAEPRPTRVLGVAGWQGSGKTTLLERLVPELVADGLSVVVLKRDAHGVDLDVAAKDSDRLFRAGAEVVLESSAEGLARWRPSSGDTLPAKLAALERRCDLVLVEGYKREGHPKIEARRKEASERLPLAETDPRIVAVAADHPVADQRLPVFSLDDIGPIADFIERTTGMTGAAPR